MTFHRLIRIAVPLRKAVIRMLFSRLSTFECYSNSIRMFEYFPPFYSNVALLHSIRVGSIRMNIRSIRLFEAFSNNPEKNHVRTLMSQLKHTQD